MDLLKRICCSKLDCNTQKKNGFSLVELMVVVTLIAILSSIAVTSVQSMMRKSRQAEASLNLRIIRTQQFVYAAQFRRFYDVDQDSGISITMAYGVESARTSKNSFCPVNGLGFIRDGDHYRYSTDALDAGGKLMFAAQARAVNTSSIGRYVRNNVNVLDIWLNNTAGEVCAYVDTIKRRVDLCAKSSWTSGNYLTFKNGILPNIANNLAAPANCQRW